MQGEQQLAIRDYEGAIDSFTVAIASRSDVLLKEHIDELISCLNDRAACFFILYRYEDAIRDISQVLARYPCDRSLFFHKRALYLERAGQLDKALKDYPRALELEPNNEKIALAVKRFSASGVTASLDFDNNVPHMSDTNNSGTWEVVLHGARKKRAKQKSRSRLPTLTQLSKGKDEDCLQPKDKKKIASPAPMHCLLCSTLQKIKINVGPSFWPFDIYAFLLAF
jgi:tetratricopeptide (TPR) repeat protein